MTEPTLPRALRPWAEPLALLHPEVQDGVGHWLHPLRSLLGPLAVPSPVSAGEPDGYAGLASRGSYERLLTSEWVLAEELPDEFLRRAAAGEHVFLAPAYREPRTASTCVVLLDCGPLQLGAPRLAHLAALVVLRQRAHEGGALLRFGVLQDDAQRLHELTGPDLGAWLAGRTWRPAEPSVAAWRERLATLDAPDTWIVGSAGLRAHADRLGAGLLEVEEATEGETAVLRVRVHHRRQASRTIALPLPPPSTCVRILRSPLAPPPVRRIAAASTGAAHDDLGQLSYDGSRWLLPREGAGIDALHVPPTTRQGPGRTKVILPRPRSTLVAADMKGKRPIALEVDEDGELVLGGSGLVRPGRWKARSLEDTVLTGLRAPPSFVRGSSRMAAMYVEHAHALSFHAWIADATQQLWELKVELSPGTHQVSQRALERLDPSVRAVWRLDAQTFVWISEEHGLKTSRTLPGHETLLLDLHDAHVAVGPLRSSGGHEALRVVVSRHLANDLLVIEGGEPPHQVPAPAGRIFGLGVPMRPSPTRRCVVLYVRPDETTVWSRGLDGNDEPLFATAAPIAAIRHEPSCNRILWCTRRGERGVYDLGREAMVLRVLPSGRPEGGP